MKKQLAMLLAAVILCLPAAPAFAEAPAVPSSDVMPAAWLDPIRVPAASAVQGVYRYDKLGRNRGQMRRSLRAGTADEICAVLNGLRAAEVVLNVPDISFIPVDRTPGDTVYEVRTGDAKAMRYYVDTGGAFIISQRVEEGMMYQGMKFTGGNTAEIIARLNAVDSYEETGYLPFEMTVPLQSVELYNYHDMTCTQIDSPSLLRRVEQLLNVTVNPGEGIHPRFQENYGTQFPDFHDMTLVLTDGTELTVRLYEEGMDVLETDENLNVPVAQSFYADKPVYDQLLSTLRAYQSACSPAWLQRLDEHRIYNIDVTDPDGRRSRSFRPGERGFASLLDAMQNIVVEPLSLQKEGRRSYPEGAYTIRIELNDDTVYTVDYGYDTVEVDATGKDYVASYRIARGFRDGYARLERLMDEA